VAFEVVEQPGHLVGQILHFGGEQQPMEIVHRVDSHLRTFI